MYHLVPPDLNIPEKLVYFRTKVISVKYLRVKQAAAHILQLDIFQSFSFKFYPILKLKHA